MGEKKPIPWKEALLANAAGLFASFAVVGQAATGERRYEWLAAVSVYAVVAFATFAGAVWRKG